MTLPDIPAVWTTRRDSHPSQSVHFKHYDERNAARRLAELEALNTIFIAAAKLLLIWDIAR